MPHHDPVAEMITHIKNASRAGKESLLVSYSSFKESILELLQKEGFIQSVSKKGTKVPSRHLEVTLIYRNGTPKITDVQRISKPSKRIYRKSDEIVPVRQGYGISVVSTPKGVLSDRQARKEKVGGELLFKIW